MILSPFFWELGTFHGALQDLAFVVYVKIVSGFITSKVFFELLTFWFFAVNLIALVCCVQWHMQDSSGVYSSRNKALERLG